MNKRQITYFRIATWFSNLIVNIRHFFKYFFKKGKKGIKVTKANFMINPLQKIPRNYPCLCMSGKKIKKCCGKERYISIVQENSIENALTQLSIMYQIDRSKVDTVWLKYFGDSAKCSPN